MVKTRPCKCQIIDVKKYNNKTVTWKDKYFYTAPQPCFLHIPIGIAVRIENAYTILPDKGLKFDEKKHMLIQKDGLFRGQLMFEVAKPKKNVKGVVKLNKKFLAKSHVGPYKEMCKTVRELKILAIKKNKAVKEIYFWYLTCPECVKGDQHKVVVLGEI